MQEEIKAELYLWGIFLVLCLALVLSLTYNIRQRDMITLQQQRIENYKTMLLKIPADLRDENGGKL